MESVFRHVVGHKITNYSDATERIKTNLNNKSREDLLEYARLSAVLFL